MRINAVTLKRQAGSPALLVNLGPRWLALRGADWLLDGLGASHDG